MNNVSRLYQIRDLVVQATHETGDWRAALDEAVEIIDAEIDKNSD